MRTKLLNKTLTTPLSKIQEQFWVLDNIEPGNTAYNIPLVYKIKGDLNLNFIKSSFSRIIEENPLLRSKIIVIDGVPFFNAYENYTIDDFLTTIELKPEEMTEEKVYEQILSEVNTPFDLLDRYLLRIKVFKSQNHSYLSIIFHHIITDLASKNQFIADLTNIYNSLGKNEEVLIADKGQYFDYTVSNIDWLTSIDASKMRNNWGKEFKHVDAPLELPKEKLISDSLYQHGEQEIFELPSSLVHDIEDFCTSNNITSFVFLLTAYSVFLSRISNQEDLVIGVPFTNRRDDKFKNTLGCFVNILPVRFHVKDDSCFNGLCKETRISLLKIHRKQEIPFIELNSLLLKDSSQRRLFDVGFTFETTDGLKLDNLSIEPLMIKRKGAQLDFFMTFTRKNNSLYCIWEYSSRMFSSESVKRYFEIFTGLCKSFIANPFSSVNAPDILPTNDKAFIEEINNTGCPYEDSVCIHEKFEQQVDQTPEAVALVTPNADISYYELEQHANRLANYLISRGTSPGDIIGICCERGPQMMISILAILKAGGIYLPLQFDAPNERILEITKDAKPKFILSTQFGAGNITEKEKIIFVGDILHTPLGNNNTRPKAEINSSDLAYIIYTSGSTGNPKGVLIEHHSVLNRIGWMQKKYPLSANDVLIQKTPITFDVSIWELFWWFFTGSRLVLLNHNGEKDPYSILDYIERFGVTKIHFVPSMFSPFLLVLNHGRLTQKIKSLDTIFFSGESLAASTIEDFYKLVHNSSEPKLVNLYGPTEATVDVSYYDCSSGTTSADKIFIGKPIDNTQLFVVNKNLKTQPVGIQGELLICGINLARGYLNKDELTKKVFVNFTTPNGENVRGYKTGDIAVLDKTGEIQYLGRVDNQIKIRGIRVELGEIEAKLVQHPKVINSAVSVIHTNSEKSIVAYAVLETPESLNQHELIEFLKKKLPTYMIPSQIIFMGCIPLTPSGKLNKKALPKPSKENLAKEYVSPVSHYEKELTKIWQEILEVENIGVTDNFFDVGGNSLLAIKLAMYVRDKFNVSVNALSVMECPNIRDFSNSLLTLAKKENHDELLQDPPTYKNVNKRKQAVRKNRIRLN